MCTAGDTLVQCRMQASQAGVDEHVRRWIEVISRLSASSITFAGSLWVDKAVKLVSGPEMLATLFISIASIVQDLVDLVIGVAAPSEVTSPHEKTHSPSHFANS